MKILSRKTPFFRVVLSYITGILLSGFFESGYDLLYANLSLIILSIYFFYTDRSTLFGISILTLCLLFGYHNTHEYYTSHSCDECGRYEGKQIEITGTIIGRPTFNNSQTKEYIPVRVDLRSDSIVRAFVQLMAVIDVSDTITSNLLIGDELELQGSLYKIKKNRNAHSFDFEKYMKRKGFRYNFYAKSCRKTKIFKSSLFRLFHKVQLYSLQKLEQYIDNEDAFAIASAMVLGYKENLSPAIENTYRQTGSAHIIAVSGLHVDIIAILLFLIIGKFYRLSFSLYLMSCIVMIILLCSYSMIIGNSPSVIRAVCMYSLLFISKMLGKGYSIWNILAASAFGMLLIRPTYLFDVGFQFSFIAVCSIVYFFPILNRFNKITYRVPKFLFDVLLVSISVQFLIAPLSIYYFNYFPAAFFIANSFLIIFIYLIIFGTISIILSSFVAENIAALLGIILEKIIHLLNTTLSRIQDIPYCIIENLYLSKWDLFIIYFYLILIVVVFKTQNLKHIKLLIYTICIHIITHNTFAIICIEKPIIYIYEIKNNILVDFIFNKECYTYSSNKKSYDSITQNNRNANHVKNVYLLNDEKFSGRYLIKKNRVIQFFDEILLVEYSGNIENVCDFNIVITSPNLKLDKPDSVSKYILNTRDSTLMDKNSHNIFYQGPLLIELNTN